MSAGSEAASWGTLTLSGANHAGCVGARQYSKLCSLPYSWSYSGSKRRKAQLSVQQHDCRSIPVASKISARSAWPSAAVFLHHAACLDEPRAGLFCMAAAIRSDVASATASNTVSTW
jgi:hypothetical protein